MSETPPIPNAGQIAELLSSGLLAATRYSFGSEGTPNLVWHVRRFSLVEGLSEPYRLSVEILTDDLDADVDALLGGAVELRIDRETTARTIYGMAARMSELGVVAERLAVHLEIVPQFALLSQVVNTRFFQEKSVPEILQEVLEGPLGAEGRSLRLDLDASTYQKREYCVQFRESDFEFASRLMQEEGIVYYFEHAPDSGAEVLVLVGATDRCREMTIADGGTVIDFVPRGSGTAHREAVDTLTPTHALRTTSVMQRDFDWKAPADSPYVHERRTRDAKNRDREVYEHQDRRLFSDDGAKRSRHKQEQHAAGKKVYVGTSDVAEFTPGYTFALLGHPDHDLDQEYLIVRVRHRGEAPEEDMFAQGAGETGTRYANEFELLIKDVPWRSELALPRPRAYGPQTAIVVGPPGEEIHTDEHGRIKVHFHWDRLSPFDDTASCWMRVAQKWAGPGWGMVFLPRIGMEVLVEFIDGDPDRPMVTGCVYNGLNRPPYPLPDQKTKSTIKSESSPGGGGFNEIRFEDAKGAEEIFIHGQLDMKTVVNRDASRQIGRDDSLTVGNDQTESVAANRTASVGGNESMSVGGDQSLSVGGNQSITIGVAQTQTIGTDQTETIGANQTLTVGAAQTVTVGAGQTVTVGASQVLTVGAAQTFNVAAGQTFNMGGNLFYSVGGSQMIQVASSSTWVVAGALTIQADGLAHMILGTHTLDSGNRTTNISGTDTLGVSGDLAITAANITLTAGGSSISITPGGITISSSGPVNVTGAVINLNA